MLKKISFCIAVIVVSLGCVTHELFAKNEIEHIPSNIPGVRGDYTSKFALLYVGMPKEYLKNTGYIKGNLLDHYKGNGKEYFVFSNWKTFQRNDTLTVVVDSNGYVVRWFKGFNRKNYPSIPVAKVDAWMKE